MSGLIEQEKKKNNDLVIKLNEYKISKKYRLILKNLSFINTEKQGNNSYERYFSDELILKESSNLTKYNKKETIQLL